jgi:hypothetical protein
VRRWTTDDEFEFCWRGLSALLALTSAVVLVLFFVDRLGV